jgi:hypothetical protein
MQIHRRSNLNYTSQQQQQQQKETRQDEAH